MLEFLLNPATIAIGATIGGSIILKISEYILSDEPDNVRAIEAPEPVKIDVPDAEKCIYFGHRQLEWSTAQNGDFDMADGLTCMEPYCPNCETIKKMYNVRQTNEARVADGLKPLPMPEYKHIYPVEKPVRRDRPSLVESIRSDSKNGYKTVKKKDGQIVFVKGDFNEREDKRPSPDAPDFQQFQWLKRNDPRYRGYTFKDYEFQQKMRRANAARNAVAKDNTAKRYDEVNKSYRNKRIAIVDGREIPIPEGVPSFADVKLVYDPVMLTDFLWWTWTYPDSPKKYGMRQNIILEFFEVTVANGQKIREWESITDPKTGEVSGSFNKTTKALSNDPADTQAAKDFLAKMDKLTADIKEMQEKVSD